MAMYTPHSAPMQLVFYTGRQFPDKYHNHAFVVFHGSWNRKPPSGYKITRLKFDGQGKFSGFEPFLSGFLVQQPDGNHGYLGRPVRIAVAKDGALLVSDDSNNMIYRVA
jgi:glucose/arabinose dehydrogenase